MKTLPFLILTCTAVFSIAFTTIPTRTTTTTAGISHSRSKRRRRKSVGSSLSSSPSSSPSSLPSPEESAKVLTDFMAKAHEEKLRAIKEVENKYRKEIEDLTQKLEQATTATPSVVTATSSKASSSSNSYEFPATNKETTSKIRAYQEFVSDYLIKSQQEKYDAVAAAERKVKEHYEGIIQNMMMKKEKDEQQ